MKNRLHKYFKLEGKSFESEQDLLVFTKLSYPGIHQFLLCWFNVSAYLEVNTSGSTGMPKPIQIKKEFMVNSAKATGLFFDLDQKTTALLCLPIGFIAGKMMLVRAMVLGWSIDVVASSSSPLKEVSKRYDFSAMVPMQLSNSLEKVNIFKKLIVGGGVVSKELQQKINKFSCKIYATYGMTETITHIAIRPLNKIAGFDELNDAYQVLPNVILSRDDRGCLVIDAPKIASETIITNDIVDIKEKDQFKWLGRFDNVINSGGVKLIPELIEKKIENLIANRFFVSSNVDTLLGEKLILIVEGVFFDIRLDQFQYVLSKYEIPKKVYFLDKFVLTGTGKINRKATKKMINITL